LMGANEHYLPSPMLTFAMKKYRSLSILRLDSPFALVTYRCRLRQPGKAFLVRARRGRGGVSWSGPLDKKKHFALDLVRKESTLVVTKAEVAKISKLSTNKSNTLTPLQQEFNCSLITYMIFIYDKFVLLEHNSYRYRRNYLSDTIF